MNALRQSSYKKRYLAHPVHAAVAQWIERLRAERPANFQDLNTDARGSYIRLRWVLRYARTTLEKVNPLLVLQSSLDGLNNQLTTLQNIWSQYKSNPEQFYGRLDTFTDSIVSAVRGISEVTFGSASILEHFDDVFDNLDAVINSSKLSLDKLQKESKDTESEFIRMRSKLEELGADVDNQKGRMDVLITQQGEVFTKGEQERAAQFNKLEQNRGESFAANQSSRDNEFKKLITNVGNRYDEMQSTHVERFNQVVSGCENATQVLVKKINDQLEKAVEVVGTIVKTSMSGNYQIIANREYTNAWSMRLAAIVSFVAVGAMVIWAVVAARIGNDGIDLYTLIVRLSFGFIFVLPGVYCARESSRHWASEKHNRRIALELASLDPFLAGLDQDQRDKVIIEKAKEYFGGESVHDVDGDVQSTLLKNINIRGDQLFKLLDQVAKIIRGK